MAIVKLLKTLLGNKPISAKILPPGSVAAFTPTKRQVVIVIELED